LKVEKVVYRFNPYTFARICAMKSLLLRKEDYDRIMKRDVNEIIKLLQENVYGEEINQLAMKYKGVELVDNALNRHMSKVFTKLRAIVDPNTLALMDQYLKRYDFFNLKTILRARQTDVPEEDLLDYLLPVGFLNAKALLKLYDKDTVAEILEASRLVNILDFKEALKKYDESKDLSDIENLLEHYYYMETVAFTKNIPATGKLFKEFFLYEFDAHNLKLILKKLYFKLKNEEIEKYILPAGKDLSSHIITELLEVTEMQDFLKVVSRTKYRDIFGDKQTETHLLKYEVLLESMLLWKRILLYHQNFLSVDVALGYMFAKEIETKNIRVIVKSKALDLKEDYIKSLIVIR
jgi:V/A-type H+/Na+-transporting ATPase subunit C